MEFKRLKEDEYSWGGPYYNPQDYGLEVVFATDAGRDYEFDMFVVLRTIVPIEGIRKGTLFYATDAGCSCPSPFEGSDWQKATKAEVVRAFDNWAGSTYRTVSGETKMRLRGI